MELSPDPNHLEQKHELNTKEPATLLHQQRQETLHPPYTQNTTLISQTADSRYLASNPFRDTILSISGDADIIPKVCNTHLGNLGMFMTFTGSWDSNMNIQNIKATYCMLTILLYCQQKHVFNIYYIVLSVFPISEVCAPVFSASLTTKN